MTAANTDTPDGLTDAQQAHVDGLRELADFLEAHPALIASRQSYLIAAGDKEGMAELVRGTGRHWRKTTTGELYLNLVADFGPHTIEVYAKRENVCERVVVATEEVTREVPDPEAMKSVPMVTVTDTIEKVEWRCPESILAEARP